MDQRYSIVILTSAPPPRLKHFLKRLAADLPEVRVAGVVYETERASLGTSKRIQRLARLIPDADFRAFVRHKLSSAIRSKFENALHSALKAIHCAPANPNGPPPSLSTIEELCDAAGTELLVTNDFHSQTSLDFVRRLQPRLGVIYSTGILKPQLFTIPYDGSINIHKHKVPDYRGAGAPGIWEMRDGREEQTVTVHRVLAAVDAGPVLGERSFPIDPLDTLTSVGLKANLVSIDLLIDVIRAQSRGRAVETPQTAEGKVYKGYKDFQYFAIEREIEAKRSAYSPLRGWPSYKLFIKSLAYPLLLFRNKKRKRNKQFPVIILFHHVITERAKQLGMPAGHFLKQIQYLKKHYRIASLPDAMEMLRKNEVTAPTVVLTFDDGYADNFLSMRAVTEAEEVPVTLFICTENVSNRAGFDHDLDREENGFPALSWDQVRYLSAHGVTIGSHTRTHFDCGSADRERLLTEIAGSAEDLRRELGYTNPYFSFPKGKKKNMSDIALQIAGQNYPFVFSAMDGVNWGPMTEPYYLYRYSHPSSLWELELMLQSVLAFRQPEKLNPPKLSFEITAEIVESKVS